MSTLAQVQEIEMRHINEKDNLRSVAAVRVAEGQPLRSGTPTIVGFMPIGAIIPGGYEIPYYNSQTKKGYQRQPQESRVNQLANDLKKNLTDLPTAVLFNIRNRQAREAVDRHELQLEKLQGLNRAKFSVVDGQHRVLALEKLMSENPETWSGFMIPFVCFLGATEQEEMEQFYIVNSTAKSVKTDLALTLLRKRAENPEVYRSLTERGREWQVQGQAIVEWLTGESSVWRNRIRAANMDKGSTTISLASMVSSLKPLLSTPYFRGLKPEQQATIVDAYWQAIREVLRPAFDQPEDYTVQKGVGVMVLHSVLPDVMECVRSRGLMTSDPSSYKKILEEALTTLQGDTAEGEIVEGVEFWASAPRGAAGSYSSSAGRRVLGAKIRQLLPPVQMD